VDPRQAYLLERPRREEVLQPGIVGYDRHGRPIPKLAGALDFYLVEPVPPFHTAVGTAQNTFTTKKDVSPQPLPVIPAGKLRIGTKLYVRAHFEYSSLTGASLTIGLWFGTRAAAITGDIALGSAFTTGTTPAAWPGWMEWSGFCTAIGTAGALHGQGQYQFGSSLTAFNAEAPFPVTAALRTVSSFDTTIERAIGVSATWGASSASNSITVNELRVKIIN
jgi:hypothetical protein